MKKVALAALSCRRELVLFEVQATLIHSMYSGCSQDRSGGEGNLRYTWKANDKKGHFEYLAIAKRKDSRHLNRYAVKRLGVANDDDRD